MKRLTLTLTLTLSIALVAVASAAKPNIVLINADHLGG